MATATETKPNKPAAARVRRAPRRTTSGKPSAEQKSKALAARHQGPVTELSDAWFEMARSGQGTALDMARGFVDLVDVVLPIQGGDDSRRRRLINGAFEFADRAAAAQLGLMRGAVKSAVMVYVDFDVNVDTDVDAFNGVDVGVDVSVPTDVGAFKNRSGAGK